MIVDNEQPLRKLLQRAKANPALSRTRLTLPSQSLRPRDQPGFLPPSTAVMALGWRKWYRVEGWVAEMGVDPRAHSRTLSSLRRG